MRQVRKRKRKEKENGDHIYCYTHTHTFTEKEMALFRWVTALFALSFSSRKTTALSSITRRRNRSGHRDRSLYLKKKKKNLV